jgi:hypothetical protein
MDPTKKPGVNSRAREGQTVPASYKTLEVLLMKFSTPRIIMNVQCNQIWIFAYTNVHVLLTFKIKNTFYQISWGVALGKHLDDSPTTNMHSYMHTY